MRLLVNIIEAAAFAALLFALIALWSIGPDYPFPMGV